VKPVRPSCADKKNIKRKEKTGSGLVGLSTGLDSISLFTKEYEEKSKA